MTPNIFQSLTDFKKDTSRGAVTYWRYNEHLVAISFPSEATRHYAGSKLLLLHKPNDVEDDLFSAFSDIVNSDVERGYWVVSEEMNQMFISFEYAFGGKFSFENLYDSLWSFVDFISTFSDLPLIPTVFPENYKAFFRYVCSLPYAPERYSLARQEDHHINEKLIDLIVSGDIHPTPKYVVTGPAPVATNSFEEATMLKLKKALPCRLLDIEAIKQTSTVRG
jgi:hypothetical protein